MSLSSKSTDMAEAVQHAEVVKKILATSSLFDSSDAMKTLEDFVDIQMKFPAVYNIDSNLAVLKHYLIFRRQAKSIVIRNILIQALMHLPSTDFDMCLCQISLEHQQSDPVIRALISVEALLQTCRFPVFWERLATDPELVGLSDVPDFKDAIRRFMAGVISLTYHTITMEDAGRLLQLCPKTELVSFCPQQLKSRWVCDTATGIVTVCKSDSAVTMLPNKPTTARPLFAPETLDDCLSAIGRMGQKHVPFSPQV